MYPGDLLVEDGGDLLVEDGGRSASAAVGGGRLAAEDAGLAMISSLLVVEEGG